MTSESTFNATVRIIDSYRSSLASDTFQVLMCGGNWMRKAFGIKEKAKGS